MIGLRVPPSIELMAAKRKARGWTLEGGGISPLYLRLRKRSNRRAGASELKPTGITSPDP